MLLPDILVSRQSPSDLGYKIFNFRWILWSCSPVFLPPCMGGVHKGGELAAGSAGSHISTLYPSLCSSIYINPILHPSNNMDWLPILTPVSISPSRTADEFREVSPPSDPVFTTAETACFEGDVSTASRSIERLLSNDAYHLDDLQGCLVKSVQSGNVSLVEMLLSERVSISVGAIKLAFRDRSKEMLSTFLRYGWNINQKMDWDQPPPLS